MLSCCHSVTCIQYTNTAVLVMTASMLILYKLYKWLPGNIKCVVSDLI